MARGGKAGPALRSIADRIGTISSLRTLYQELTPLAEGGDAPSRHQAMGSVVTQSDLHSNDVWTDAVRRKETRKTISERSDRCDHSRGRPDEVTTGPPVRETSRIR
jgi:hypothetical protein